MYEILKTIDFLGHNISNNEIVSMKPVLSQQNVEEENALVHGGTARKRSESECFLQNMRNLVKLCMAYEEQYNFLVTIYRK